MSKKITLKDLAEMTPEDLLNNFPYTAEERERLKTIFENIEEYSDEDYFDACYQTAKKHIETRLSTP